MKPKKYYAYVAGEKKGVAASWQECQNFVLGVPNARFKGFSTRQEAERWLKEGADYRIKHIAAQPGVYFDAGTGGGNGVEINVTDERGKSFVKKRLPPGSTNNFGELLACKCALEVAKENDAKKIFGDSKLIIDFWSKGYLSKDILRKTANLAGEVRILRQDFEKSGGKIKRISGADNPADLGFHRD